MAAIPMRINARIAPPGLPTLRPDNCARTKALEMREPQRIALLVEDDKQIRRFVRAALEQHGWLVYEAGTAARGLSEASTRRPDLVILDLGLPDADGIDLLRDLRAWSEVAVIVLSARRRT